MKVFLVVFTTVFVLFTQSGFGYEEMPSANPVPEGAILFNDGGGHVYLVYSDDGSTVTILDTTGVKLGEVENKAVPSVAKEISKLVALDEVVKVIQARAKNVEGKKADCPSGYFKDPAKQECKVKFQR
jgi:hypothetical protein